MTAKDVNDFIDSLHFKTFNHVIDAVKEKFTNLSDSEVQRIVDKRLKDHYIRKREIKPYMIKIFSTRPNCWFHDLYDNREGNSPRYWHVFIGTNNRYAVAYPLHDKKASSIHETLQSFIDEYHPVKLTSDEESGFIEKNNLKLLTDNNVLVQTVPDKNHSTLGIIDRFMRTLRDMNTPHEHSKRQSHDDKYTFITEDRMRKFLNIYNNSYHNSIGCSPKKMFDNPDVEKEYIFKCLDKQEKQQKMPNFEFKDGWFVRFIVPRDTSKKRYQLSKECYKIDGKTGKMYNLLAQDGTTIIKPRYQLFLCTDNGSKPDNIRWADTIPGKWNGTVDEILSYDRRKNKYKVRFTVPGQKSYVDWIPASFLRGNYPQQVSELERRFNST